MLVILSLKATVLHLPQEVDPLWVELRLPRAKRSSIEELQDLYVSGEEGQIVQLGSIGKFIDPPPAEDQTIYHKNLQRVVYIYGEVAGRPPADAILDMQLDRVAAGEPLPAAERSATKIIPTQARRRDTQKVG